MKLLSIFSFLILIVLTVNSQQVVVSGKVVSYSNGEPIQSVNIVHLRNTLGCVTDNKGCFTMVLSSFEPSDSLRFSSIGYIKTTISVADAVKGITVVLKKQFFELDEIVVNPKKVKAKKFMKKVVQRYNDFRNKNPHIALAHYSENAMVDNKYVMFMESIGYSIYAGLIPNAALLSNYKFFCENSRCFIDSPDWIAFKSPVFKNDKYIPIGAGNNLNGFRNFEVRGLLSEKYGDRYSFKFISSYLLNDYYVYKIRFKGRGDSGFIHVFAESFNILKIECTTKKFWSTVFHKRVKSDVCIEFNYFDSVPYVSNIYCKTEKRGLIYCNSIKILTQKFNKFDFSNNEYWSFVRYNSNPYLKYTPELWKQYNVPILPYYDVIKDDIKMSGVNLEKHFINFSGHWLYEKGYSKSKVAIKRLNELRKYF